MSGSGSRHDAAGVVHSVERGVKVAAEATKEAVMNRQNEVVAFSSIAIALYGYDQGMMSLVNTNSSYLRTMGIGPESPLVAVIVSVYYLGCAIGAVFGSQYADRSGRKPAILACIVTACLGNLIMFFAGWNLPGHGWSHPEAAMATMLVGRVVMGMGVGAFDAVIPVFSAELTGSQTRGRALAQEFQANIFGLNMAFIINVVVSRMLGKWSQWAWRIPIIAMQIYPLILFTFISRLPESPRWLVFAQQLDRAKSSLKELFGEDDAQQQFENLEKVREEEQSATVSYADMLTPGRSQYHPTVITVMGQVNQGLTGYGCISVYGPQIFELLGFSVISAEHITVANYISYFIAMTPAWLLIDRLGRRKIMHWGSGVLIVSFVLLTVLGAIVMRNDVYVPIGPPAIAGTIVLFIATAAFGIGWLTPPWLIPTEIYPSQARAKGAAISVIVWGLCNFCVTFASPILFNGLKYWIFLIFAVTNGISLLWTWMYSPESGGRSFEENTQFFIDAYDQGTWRVHKVDHGAYLDLPEKDAKEDNESQPLLR